MFVSSTARDANHRHSYANWTQFCIHLCANPGRSSEIQYAPFKHLSFVLLLLLLCSSLCLACHRKQCSLCLRSNRAYIYIYAYETNTAYARVCVCVAIATCLRGGRACRVCVCGRKFGGGRRSFRRVMLRDTNLFRFKHTQTHRVV